MKRDFYGWRTVEVASFGEVLLHQGICQVQMTGDIEVVLYWTCLQKVEQVCSTVTSKAGQRMLLLNHVRLLVESKHSSSSSTEIHMGVLSKNTNDFKSFLCYWLIRTELVCSVHCLWSVLVTYVKTTIKQKTRDLFTCFLVVSVMVFCRNSYTFKLEEQVTHFFFPSSQMKHT